MTLVVHAQQAAFLSLAQDTKAVRELSCCDVAAVQRMQRNCRTNTMLLILLQLRSSISMFYTIPSWKRVRILASSKVYRGAIVATKDSEEDVLFM